MQNIQIFYEGPVMFVVTCWLKSHILYCCKQTAHILEKVNFFQPTSIKLFALLQNTYLEKNHKDALSLPCHNQEHFHKVQLGLSVFQMISYKRQ